MAGNILQSHVFCLFVHIVQFAAVDNFNVLTGHAVGAGDGLHHVQDIKAVFELAKHNVARSVGISDTTSGR